MREQIYILAFPILDPNTQMFFTVEIQQGIIKLILWKPLKTMEPLFQQQNNFAVFDDKTRAGL